MRHTIRFICIIFLSSFSLSTLISAKADGLAVSNFYSFTMDTADYQLIIDYVNENGENGHQHPTTSEDYYGASSFYNNFDARAGKYDVSFASSEEAIEEAISTLILPARFLFVNLNDTIALKYRFFDGSTKTEIMHFKCISTEPLAFASIDVEKPSGSGGKIHFGTDSSFDIVTWNIEHFPKSGNTTSALVKEWIVSLDADFYALQEIDDTTSFKQMVAQMDGYNAIIGDYEYAPLCFLYRSDSIIISSSYQLFSDDNTNFPRAPLVVELTFRGQDYIVVNNHLKCCGDGILDPGNSYDEENRRQSAMQKLKDYMDTNWADKSVIVVGDFNDVLEDKVENNVFQGFLNDEAHYTFADKHISFGDQSNWSYPSWPSHLDHMLITDELFAIAQAEIIKIDSILSWDRYDEDLSDHRPVGLRIHYPDWTETTTRNNPIKANGTGTKIVIGPNPFNTHLDIQNLPDNELLTIQVLDTYGKVQLHMLSQHRSTLSLDLSKLHQGIYLIMLAGENWQSSTKIVKQR